MIVGGLSSLENIRYLDIYRDAVDGRYPAPVDMVNMPIFCRVSYMSGVQDFLNQQYFSS